MESGYLETEAMEAGISRSQKPTLTWWSFLAIIHNVVVWPFTWSAITHLAYWFACCPLSKLFIPLYARWFGIDAAEAALPLKQYPTIAALFLRDLKPGVRPIHPEATSVIAPVDGMIVDCGSLRRDLNLRAKGIDYALEGLLGDRREAERFVGGQFMVIYMNAGAYHHVHSPLTAEICSAKFIPGRHFPLYELSQKSIKGLYSRNTRQVNYLCRKDENDEAKQTFALVQIASTLVGSIQNLFTTETAAKDRPSFAKGEEIGRFAFGSTVILLFPPDMIRFAEGIHPEAEVRMGQKIAEII